LTAALLSLLVCGAQACVEEEERNAQNAFWEEPDYETRAQNLTSMCRVNVQGRGWVDTEEDYLPRVIACENGNAPLEALKAQAIAARTYAKFKMDIERVAIPDSQAGQVYTCSRQPSDLHRQAVRETAGQVLTYNGRITAGFYVSGARPTTSTCVPSSQDIASASATDRRVEGYVTYNRGRTGSNVRPAQRPIGHPANPHNRGVKSQNGASCLANQGRSAAQIVRFYYGDDIQLTSLGGECAMDGDRPVNPPPADPNANDASTCRSTDAAPTIVRRSQWGARTPRSNRAIHTPNRITIHHSASYNRVHGGNGVKGIQNYHMDNQRWSDIGYHYLVDQDGTIYEGNPENRQGAHVLNQNSGNLGICLLGHFDNGDPTDAQLKAAAHLTKHLANKYNIGLNRNNVKGHGERMATACPGRTLRPKLDQLVQLGAAETICTDDGGNRPGGSSNDNPYEYQAPQVTIDGSGMRFIRYGNRAGSEGNIELDAPHILADNRSIPMKSIVSSSGVQNAQGAAGLPDVTDCGSRNSRIAIMPPGSHIVFELPAEYERAEFLSFDGGTGAFNGGRDISEGCPPNQSGYAILEYSRDGQNWVPYWEVVLIPLNPPSTISGFKSGIEFKTPVSMQIPRSPTFTVNSTADIVRVEYYAEQWRLGESSDRGTDFSLTYRFNGTGRRLLSAIGYDMRGKPVAKTERYYVVGDGLSFISPRDGGRYSPELSFQVAASDDVTRIEYVADGQHPIGSSENRAGNFRVDQTLNQMGERTITARAFDADGNLVDEVSIKITVAQGQSNFRFAYPNEGGSYKPNVRFLMEVARPDITRVEYKADPNFPLGSSSDASTQFAHSYTFTQFGRRTITATGFNAQGQQVATAQIQILVTDQNGAVPGGSTNDPPPVNNPTGPNNDSSAERLAREAYKLLSSRRGSRRRADGSQLGSSGYCWHYVYEALVRWGLSGTNYSRLAGAGPCTSAQFGNSAYCVGRNAKNNPQTLQREWGLTRLNVAPSQAPRGALITWDPGCAGFHAVHGHIEVAMGDGTACSDYCGRIRTGNPSCAGVFIHNPGK
jgi:hypothetical protein